MIDNGPDAVLYAVDPGFCRDCRYIFVTGNHPDWPANI
jgi:hypothetical protein